MPAGEVGEICIKSPTVFLGYWENPDATEAALWPGRWYRTGDFGRIDDDVLFVESRMRDLILRGGENIYPIEIEHRLVEHPEIADAAVVGVDHRELGQEVKAYVVRAHGLRAHRVRRAGSGWEQHSRRTRCRPTSSSVMQLPYTASGKLIKLDL